MIKKMSYNLEKNKIYNEDCIEGMKKISDKTVDIIIADPPYNIGKEFGNDSDKQSMSQYIKWCEKWIDECLRILKDDGTLYIYGFSEILSYIRVMLEPIDDEKKKKCNVRWIVWHYTNKVVPSLKFWQRSHESILVCYKKEKPNFNRDLVREPYSEGFLNGSAGKSRPNTKGRFSDGSKTTVYKAHEKGALPRDIIKGIATLAGGAGKKERVNHPTQKPVKICEKLFLAAMKVDKDNLAVIPFCGSGSECVSAKQLNIDFIGFELNEEYIKIANKRLDV
jgi:site-specific DNA-methyltransferase (adenine-specific)